MTAQAEHAAPVQRLMMPGFRQPAFITLAVLIIGVVMALTSAPFRSYDNLYNDSRNFAFVAIMGMGELLVIITGGIDLSVGSVMGLVGIVTALVLQAGHSLWVGVGAGLGVALLCGLINGYAIARFRLSPFIVTLIMLSMARSQALIVSNNKMIYQFGPDEKLFGALGGGKLLGVPSVVIVMAALAIILSVALSNTSWGRYVYAIGGNEQAALLTGVPVIPVKVSVYVISSLMAGVAAILMVGWLGAVTNDAGRGVRASGDRSDGDWRRRSHGRLRNPLRAGDRRRPHRDCSQFASPRGRRPLLARHIRGPRYRGRDPA